MLQLSGDTFPVKDVIKAAAKRANAKLFYQKTGDGAVWSMDGIAEPYILGALEAAKVRLLNANKAEAQTEALIAAEQLKAANAAAAAAAAEAAALAALRPQPPPMRAAAAASSGKSMVERLFMQAEQRNIEKRGNFSQLPPPRPPPPLPPRRPPPANFAALSPDEQDIVLAERVALFMAGKDLSQLTPRAVWESVGKELRVDLEPRKARKPPHVTHH